MRKIKNIIKLKETPLPDEWKPIVRRAIEPNEDKVFNVKDFIRVINKELTDVTVNINGEEVRITRMVGLGSSRVVYEVTSGSEVGTVYKFPINQKGLVQNQNELRILEDSEVKRNPLIIKPIDFDNSSSEYINSKSPLWIQYEKLDTFTSPTAFPDYIWFPYFGFSFKTFKNYLFNISNKSRFPDNNQKVIRDIKSLVALQDIALIPDGMDENEYADNVYEEYKEHWDHLVNFLRILKKYDLLIGDVQILDNWGAREEIPVFLDIGIDQKSYYDLYAKKT